jgi:squalene-hopene/tetraprenyl-beta-curcumene cyclase
MKHLTLPAIALALTCAHAQEDSPNPYLSIQNEMSLAISRGNQYLAEKQHEDGYWGDPELPAFTALALTSAVRDPAVDLSEPLPEHLRKGYQWLIEQQKDDGGIYNRGLSSYNTATAVTAMVAAKREAYEPAIVRARNYLISQQWDLGEAGVADNPNDGGIGYGSNDSHTDLSNTVLAVEALALSKQIVGDAKYGDQPELDWDAALTFLSRCQNLEETNDQDWASNDPENKGGFIYRPGESKAGEQELEDGTVALRSYGSISYAGLLSLIYAEVSKDDPRVVAVLDWIGRNYTLEKNPGMGLEGLYYYYQAISKALSAAGIDKLELESGETVDWRKDLALKLLTTQREDGSWANSNSRWMESSPVLVTSYTVMALEQIYYSIPARP